MTPTDRRLLTLVAIACLLVVSALADSAGAAGSEASPPDSAASPSGSLAAFAERVGAEKAPVRVASLRNAVELLILVAACGIVAAFYSALRGEQGDKRRLTRIRRR